MHNAVETFHQIAHALKGARISHVWRGYGSALFVECGRLSESQVSRKDGSSGNPKGQWSIGLECDWRIEAESCVVCGSHDEKATWAKTLASLVDDDIASVEMFGDVAELRVTLHSGKKLLTFALDHSGPEWSLTDNGQEPAVWVYWSDGSLRTDDGRQPR
jgi:hypothetical protein